MCHGVGGIGGVHGVNGVGGVKLLRAGAPKQHKILDGTRSKADPLLNIQRYTVLAGSVTPPAGHTN